MVGSHRIVMNVLDKLTFLSLCANSIVVKLLSLVLKSKNIHKVILYNLLC